ncbi:hypothetical protein [Fodinicola acaciae]|uniref:hypothetical protein n=1 Tax=Fodinicola acaciae TaxID=2681555 RepID=UPI0013D42CBE|nr:hypothetical protein [Fodinicola acaciae]
MMGKAYDPNTGEPIGEQWESGGTTYTAKSTDDPKAPGGYFLSQQDERGKETAVYNADGTLADVDANKNWQ